jgi:hypothetical protein
MHRIFATSRDSADEPMIVACILGCLPFIPAFFAFQKLFMRRQVTAVLPREDPPLGAEGSGQPFMV